MLSQVEMMLPISFRMVWMGRLPFTPWDRSHSISLLWVASQR